MQFFQSTIAIELAVEPTRSAKTTVTTLRSSRREGTATASGVPHSEQNFAGSAFSNPHAGHEFMGCESTPGKTMPSPRGAAVESRSRADNR